MKHSFVRLLLKPFSGHTQKTFKVDFTLRAVQAIKLEKRHHKTSLNLTPKKPYSKDPRSFDRAYRSYPPHSQAWPLVSLTLSTVTNQHR
jgi:hypothetical protein